MSVVKNVNFLLDGSPLFTTANEVGDFILLLSFRVLVRLAWVIAPLRLDRELFGQALSMFGVVQIIGCMGILLPGSVIEIRLYKAILGACGLLEYSSSFSVVLKSPPCRDLYMLCAVYWKIVLEIKRVASSYVVRVTYCVRSIVLSFAMYA